MCRLLKNEAFWITGPLKIPSLNENKGPAAIDTLDLKGTYEAKGCQSRLHVVGVQDVALPANVQHLRDNLLKQEIFGRPAAEISLMAIWDTEEAYMGDFFNLSHVGNNVFFGEMYKLCPEASGRQGVLLPTSAVSPSLHVRVYIPVAIAKFPCIEQLWGPSSEFLFYALEDSDGNVKLEAKAFWGDNVPQVGEGEGDCTFVKISSF